MFCRRMRSVPVPHLAVWAFCRQWSRRMLVLQHGRSQMQSACNRHVQAPESTTVQPRRTPSSLHNGSLRPIEMPMQIFGIVSGTLVRWELMAKIEVPVPAAAYIGARVLGGAIIYNFHISQVRFAHPFQPSAPFIAQETQSRSNTWTRTDADRTRNATVNR